VVSPPLQYPKGLGKTVQELDISHASLTSEKTKFTMLTPEVTQYLEKHSNLKSVVLFGVEVWTDYDVTIRLLWFKF